MSSGLSRRCHHAARLIHCPARRQLLVPRRVPALSSHERPGIPKHAHVSKHIVQTGAVTEPSTAEGAAASHDKLDASTVLTAITPTTIDSSKSPFSWTKTWWPLAPVDYLDPSRPKAMTVMGVRVVVWRDGQGQWRCFKDACPHRLAPLSEGRVEADGTLLCAYHAWRFDGEGKCTTIPQATSPEAEATAKGSKRSCATAFPVQERVGLLWVWPDDSPDRWVEAAASPTLVPDLLQQRWEQDGGIEWFMRDLPYSYEMLLENNMDASHFPSAHHKLLPSVSRYKIAPLQFELDSKPESAEGMHAGVNPIASYRYSKGAQKSPMQSEVTMLRFTPPFHVQYVSAENVVQAYCVPVAPHRSRIVNVTLRPSSPAASGAAAGLAKALQMLVFRLLFPQLATPAGRHRLNLKVFDQDGVFLNMQENNLLREHGGNWRSYYMPAPCDKAISAALRWVDSVGHPFPFTAATTQGTLDRRVLLDRYTQHTAHCPICQQQVHELESMVRLARACAAACFLAACGVAGSVGLQGLFTASVPFVTPAAAGVALLVGVAAWCATGLVARLEAVRQEYFFTDYVHASVD